jgi:hypothetical protein
VRTGVRRFQNYCTVQYGRSTIFVCSRRAEHCSLGLLYYSVVVYVKEGDGRTAWKRTINRTDSHGFKHESLAVLRAHHQQDHTTLHFTLGPTCKHTTDAVFILGRRFLSPHSCVPARPPRPSPSQSQHPHQARQRRTNTIQLTSLTSQFSPSSGPKLAPGPNTHS